MSLYAFIATQTTYERTIPSTSQNPLDFQKRVRQAFQANRGRPTLVGEILFFAQPTPGGQTSGLLLCDGSTITRAQFPELVTYLGGTDNAVLPNYSGALSVTSPPTQTIQPGGTVSIGGTVTSPSDPSQVGGTTGGNIPSGGRAIDEFRIDDRR